MEQLSPFKLHNLPEEDLRLGQVLSPLQRQVMENLQHQIAVQKLHLPVDPEITAKFMQQEAYLRGQLDIISFLLSEGK